MNYSEAHWDQDDWSGWEVWYFGSQDLAEQNLPRQHWVLRDARDEALGDARAAESITPGAERWRMAA